MSGLLACQETGPPTADRSGGDMCAAGRQFALCASLPVDIVQQAQHIFVEEAARSAVESNPLFQRRDYGFAAG